MSTDTTINWIDAFCPEHGAPAKDVTSCNDDVTDGNVTDTHETAANDLSTNTDATNTGASLGEKDPTSSSNIIDFSKAKNPVTTPPDTIAHHSPPQEQRPRYHCYGDFWLDHNGKQHGAGVWYHGAITGKGDNPKTTLVDTWICGELYVDAIARDKTARSFGQVLRFKNKLGQWCSWNMPTRLLAGRGDELLKELLDMGLAFNHPKLSRIPVYISTVTPRKTVWTANQVGWFEGNFVLPDATIGNEAEQVIFQTEYNNHIEYTPDGSLKDWRDSVAPLCVGNPLLLFSVSTAFAGALLNSCNMDGAGFHIFGESSKGKTTGLKLASSVWGHWERYRRTWKATANGLEGAAALFNDGLLTLDELGDIEANELANAVYMLGNGSGKQRASKDGAARGVKKWRVVILSNGEVTIDDRLATRGIKAKAGQLVRFLHIPLFGKYGAFDELHGFHTARAFADEIVKRASKSYGMAGREYLERLTRDESTLANLPQQIDDALALFTARFGSLSPQESRAAKSFALVAIAGELATDYGVTGWTAGMAMDSALTCFAQWREHRGEGDTESLQIKDAVTAYIETYGDARFTSVDDDTRLHGMRSGYWRDHWQGKQWLFTDSGLMEAAKGFGIKQVINTLKDAGWLILDSEGRAKTRANFRNNESNENRFYVVRICNVEKSAGTTGTAGTAGTAMIIKDKNSTQLKNETGTTGTKSNHINSNCTHSTQSEKLAGTEFSNTNQCSTHSTRSTHEKTNNTNHTPENTAPASPPVSGFDKDEDFNLREGEGLI